MPIGLSRMIQAGLPQLTFSSMPELVSEVTWQEEVGNSLIVKEPVGVVAAITPWNYPLHQIANKVAPALAAGCTVVLKPSEVVPLNAFVLAEVIEEVGLPAGVFNLVTGTGPVVGEAIVSHPETDMVSFTGSTRAGRRVSELAAQAPKPVTLELGGKSPNVILDDADLEEAVTDGMAKCYLNSGQTCSALTRMLVPRDKLEQAEQLAATIAEEAFKPGDPFQDGRGLGPLVSEAQLERVRGYIKKGEEEGARLVTGGAEPPEGLERGYFVRPTVFSDVTSDMTIAQEEIFGPVLVLIPYEDEEDAIRIANDSVYGLAGGVWSADEERAKRVAGADPHGPGRDQRRRLQPHGAVRRLQAVRPRPRAGPLRPRGVPRGEVAADLMPGGWTVALLDDVQAVPWQGRKLEWRPLRSALETRIVGMAGFTAERVGQEVIEGHTEAHGGRGHEEVYVVLRGRATFTLGAETVDAPAGTFIAVRDTTVFRRAVAAEPHTAVCALGGPPTFEPSASEWIERARPLLRSDPAEARELLDELRRERPESPGVRIGEALWALSQGEDGAARELLTSVIASNPDLQAALEHDPDLGRLVTEP